jgi:hypothetical protein
MGLLNFMKKGASEEPSVIRLPTGSFTIDATGRVVVSTLPRAFPSGLVKQISDLILGTFRSAREREVPLTEIVADYTALRLTARELRGGAIIFLAPRTLAQR